MMKRVIWIIVALLVGAYFLSNHSENKAKMELKKAKEERIMEARKAAVVTLVKRNNAVDNWAQDLQKGDSYISGPIQTLDLERLWLKGRPILFLGVIRDIATSDQKNYRVVIDHNYMLPLKLRLILSCKKQLVDSFLNEHPDLFQDFYLNSGVGIIASIDEIKKEFGSGENAEEILIGKGKCIDIAYTGKEWFSYKLSE